MATNVPIFAVKTASTTAVSRKHAMLSGMWLAVYLSMVYSTTAPWLGLLARKSIQQQYFLLAVTRCSTVLVAMMNPSGRCDF